MNNYKLQAPYEPNGDQPKAIKKLVQGVNSGKEFQTLLGATGTGKTFTIANVIQQTGRPALILAHNKTLAAQLCNELRQFFPKNAVEYFISYYDYYQPEAYVPVSDTYIAKTSSINEEFRSNVPRVNSLSKSFEKFSHEKKLPLGRSNLKNRLRCIFPKFEAERSHVRGGMADKSCETNPILLVFGMDKSNVGNRLKNVLAKFQANAAVFGGSTAFQTMLLWHPAVDKFNRQMQNTHRHVCSCVLMHFEDIRHSSMVLTVTTSYCPRRRRSKGVDIPTP